MAEIGTRINSKARYAIEVTTTEDVPAGAQLFVSYREADNERLLLQYVPRILHYDTPQKKRNFPTTQGSNELQKMTWNTRGNTNIGE